MVTWAFAPEHGKVDFAAIVKDPKEFEFIRRRGFVRLNGQVADLLDDNPNHCDPESGFMRFRFREPFRNWLPLQEAA